MTSQIESGDQALSVLSDEEKAQAVPHVTPKSLGPFVKYTGPQTGSGTFAQVDPEHWAQQGIAATRSFEWKLQNKWRIPASQFSAEQLDYLLNNTKGRFVLVDAKGVKVVES